MQVKTIKSILQAKLDKALDSIEYHGMIGNIDSVAYFTEVANSINDKLAIISEYSDEAYYYGI